LTLLSVSKKSGGPAWPLGQRRAGQPESTETANAVGSTTVKGASQPVARDEAEPAIVRTTFLKIRILKTRIVTRATF